MPVNDNDDLRARLASIREIAKGIFDLDERKAILDLAADYAALVNGKERTALHIVKDE